MIHRKIKCCHCDTSENFELAHEVSTEKLHELLGILGWSILHDKHICPKCSTLTPSPKQIMEQWEPDWRLFSILEVECSSEVCEYPEDRFEGEGERDVFMQAGEAGWIFRGGDCYCPECSKEIKKRENNRLGSTSGNIIH